MRLLEHENIDSEVEYKLFLREDNLYEVHLLSDEYKNSEFKIQIWKDIKSHNRWRIFPPETFENHELLFGKNENI